MGRSRFAIGFSVAVVCLATAKSTHGQVTFSVDYQGTGTMTLADCTAAPPPVTEGDLLTPAFGLPGPGVAPPPCIAIYAGPPAPGPNLGLPAYAGPLAPLGLPNLVEVDAISFGLDFPVDFTLAPPGTFPAALSFSVDEFAAGIPSPIPPNVFTEGVLGAMQASADVNVMLTCPPAAFCAGFPVCGNTQLFDGDGVAPPAAIALPLPFGGAPVGLGLGEPNPPGPVRPDVGDNLDALDVDTLGPPVVPVYFSLDSGSPDPLELGPPFPFPNSGSAIANGGFSGSDILVNVPGGLPVVFAGALALGLDFGGFDTDDVDAFALWENGTGVFEPSLVPGDWVGGGTDMLLYSVRRGSAIIGVPDGLCGLPIEEGDILTTPPGGFGPPGIVIMAERLGLATVRSGTAPGPFGDDLDALDVSPDCNVNSIPDLLDIAYGIEMDVDGNLIPDSCCVVPAALAPVPPAKNRYISFTGGTPGGTQAVRVTLAALPPPLAALVGDEMWVTAPIAVSEIAGSSGPIPLPTFNAATLACAPTCLDWSVFGAIHVSAPEIVPGADYELEIVDCACIGMPALYSPAVTIPTSGWGDVVGAFVAGTWTAPNGVVAISSDVVALLDKFANRPSAPSKPRCDLEPATPDRRINISDVTRTLDAFRGLGYPYFAAAAGCP